ncbi:hypothetical protein HLB27_17105 [Dickeya dadantii]|uniref:hypothetical protein n=1 Tax=Dickeya dadantii TaxID=204038 RepID=UPI001495C8BA|nr:hypothetical protein [Dickeya dadantii]NPE59197.1 hypothetical protein [Dickeya dadantii]NPE72135.1 hypothetical protein [Dickeya dadantii]QWT41067.1 hypothetical protein KNV89_00500 [Dickeya dadantii]
MKIVVIYMAANSLFVQILICNNVLSSLSQHIGTRQKAGDIYPLSRGEKSAVTAVNVSAT